MAYSIDLRQRVLARVDEGHSVEATATLFQVSPATIYL
ncbi:MAG: IS630 transposase-related protein [Cyanobacteria bacterium J06638_22]